MPFGLKTTKVEKKPKEAGEKMEVGGAEDMEVGQPDGESIEDIPTDQSTNDDLHTSTRESEGHDGQKTIQPQAMDTQEHEEARETPDGSEGDGDPDTAEQNTSDRQGNEDSQETLCGHNRHGGPNVKKQKGGGKQNANTSNVEKQNAGVKKGNGDSHAASGGPAGRGDQNVAEHNAGGKQGNGNSHAASGRPAGRGSRNENNEESKQKASSPKLTDIPGIEEQSRKTPTPFNQQHHDEIHNNTSGWAHGGSQVHGHGDNQSSRGQSHDQSHGHASGGQWGMHSTRDQQMQDQILREAQASKQMVYEVYGNCITMLEEMESRELKKKGHTALPRSDIYLPDQKKFDDKTIQRKLDTQLILLQCQLTSCNDGIKDEVKDELKEHTINWGSQREDKKIPNGLTDDYTQKLYELLDTGKTNHPTEFDKPPTIGEKDMQNALGAIMQGQQKQSDLDKSFKKDSKKKASGPNMRQTAGGDKGADRIVRGRKDFEKSVDNHRSTIL